MIENTDSHALMQFLFGFRMFEHNDETGEESTSGAFIWDPKQMLLHSKMEDKHSINIGLIFDNEATKNEDILYKEDEEIAFKNILDTDYETYMIVSFCDLT